MGCTSTKHKFVMNPEIAGQNESVYDILPIMEIDEKELDIIYTIYVEMDVHNSKNIQPSDIFTFVNLPYSNFEKSVLQIFDADKSGKFNFLEFVCMMWNFLTIPEEQLGAILYLMKDPSGTLRVRYSDIREALEIVYKRKLDSSPSIMSIIHDLRDNYPPEVSIQNVVQWSSTVGNTTIMTPILLLQLKFRKLLIGEKYWLQKTKKRSEDPVKCRVEYIKEFQNIVKNKLADFARKKDIEAKEAKAASRTRMGRAEANIARKQSILLDVFKLKGPASAGSPSRVSASAPATDGEGEKKLFGEGSKKMKPGAITTTSSSNLDAPLPRSTSEKGSPSPSKKRPASSKKNSSSSINEEAVERKKSGKF